MTLYGGMLSPSILVIVSTFCQGVDLGANIFAGTPGQQIPLAIPSTGSTVVLEKK